MFTRRLGQSGAGLAIFGDENIKPIPRQRGISERMANCPRRLTALLRNARKVEGHASIVTIRHCSVLLATLCQGFCHASAARHPDFLRACRQGRGAVSVTVMRPSSVCQAGSVIRRTLGPGFLRL